jgi:hypothetical protein
MKGKSPFLYKTLVVGITILFLGVGIQPVVAIIEPEEDIIDVEPKDYLFQTIIDIANNPDVKNLLEQYDNDLFKVEIDRSVYRKLFLRNPRLFRSFIITKPCVTYDSLESLYKHGTKIIQIIGEDKSLDILESIYIKNKPVFEQFNGIIENDDELSGKIENLKNLKIEISSAGIGSRVVEIICSFLLGISMGIFGIALGIAKIFGGIMDIFSAMCFNRLATFFQMTGLILCSPFVFLWFITFMPAFACLYDPPPYDG